jgi:hypothetical protein
MGSGHPGPFFYRGIAEYSVCYTYDLAGMLMINSLLCEHYLDVHFSYFEEHFFY